MCFIDFELDICGGINTSRKKQQQQNKSLGSKKKPQNNNIMPASKRICRPSISDHYDTPTN